MCVFFTPSKIPHSTATPTAPTHGQGGCIGNSEPLLGGEMFRLRNEQHVASLNMTQYKCAVIAFPFANYLLPYFLAKLLRPPKLT